VLEDLRVTDGAVPQMSVSRNGNLAYLPKSAGPTALELVWADRAGAVTPLPFLLQSTDTRGFRPTDAASQRHSGKGVRRGRF
jgi:hypothetical protein